MWVCGWGGGMRVGRGWVREGRVWGEEGVCVLRVG